MSDPTYRIKMSIYDDESGEEVSFVDEPMLSQGGEKDAITNDNEASYQRLMRKFHDERQEFEDENYGDDDVEEEEYD